MLSPVLPPRPLGLTSRASRASPLLPAPCGRARPAPAAHRLAPSAARAVPAPTAAAQLRTLRPARRAAPRSARAVRGIGAVGRKPGRMARSRSRRRSTCSTHSKCPSRSWSSSHRSRSVSGARAPRSPSSSPTRRRASRSTSAKAAPRRRRPAPPLRDGARKRERGHHRAAHRRQQALHHRRRFAAVDVALDRVRAMLYRLTGAAKRPARTGPRAAIAAIDAGAAPSAMPRRRPAGRARVGPAGPWLSA